MTSSDNVTYAEYDLNLFLPDEQVEEQYDVYTVQPSVYMEYEDGRTARHYMDSIVLDLAETRVIRPDFPVDFWGSDFFISLESFKNIAKSIPPRLNSFINELPEIGSLDLYNSGVRY